MYLNNIVYDIGHYLSFAAVLDASIGVQELCLSSLNQPERLDSFPALKRIQCVSPIQFVSHQYCTWCWQQSPTSPC